MSTAPSQILHAHLGAPAVAEAVVLDAPTLCWVCAGSTTRAVLRDDWNGASYTGQSKVRCPGSQWVCEACVHIHSRIAPVPGRPPAEGKQFGGNFRNYSHLWDDAGEPRYMNASKGQKPIILAWLRRAKTGMWWAAIADSGQKHVIPWAPVNGAGTMGRVLFDETIVALPDQNGWRIVDDMVSLLTAGATKDEITSGDYGPGAWMRCRETIASFEARWSSKRRGAWFGLAIWLAQRDEEAVAERQAAERGALAERKAKAKPTKAPGKARAERPSKPAKERSKRGTGRENEGETENADGGGAALVPSGVPEGGGVATEALGPVAGQGTERSSPVVDSGGVGDGVRPRPATPVTQQLGLPGFG